MTAVFTAPPQFTVLAGRQEIGRTDPMLLHREDDGPRLLLLGGRSWKVTWTDWKRRRCYVEPAEGGGKARWLTPGISGAGFELARAIREVLLGADPRWPSLGGPSGSWPRSATSTSPQCILGVPSSLALGTTSAGGRGLVTGPTPPSPQPCPI